MSTLSLYKVTSRDTRRALSTNPYHNQRVDRLSFRRQRVKQETWLEQHFRAADRRSKGYRVSTCRLALTFVSAFDHCSVLITTNIKHVLPATSLDLAIITSDSVFF